MTVKGKVYIAGPMRGIPFYNFPAFDAEAAAWRADGWEVVNPADLDREVGFDAMTLHAAYDWTATPSGFDFDACVERDLSALRDCQAIVMLPGWEASAGARAELAVAEWCGLDVIKKDEPVLAEAVRITSGARRRDYDHATPNHRRIATLWNAYIAMRPAPPAELTPADVAAMMILLKLARHAYTPKRDNCVDIAGYARCLAQIGGFEP